MEGWHMTNTLRKGVMIPVDIMKGADDARGSYDEWGWWCTRKAPWHGGMKHEEHMKGRDETWGHYEREGWCKRQALSNRAIKHEKALWKGGMTHEESILIRRDDASGRYEKEGWCMRKTIWKGGSVHLGLWKGMGIMHNEDTMKCRNKTWRPKYKRRDDTRRIHYKIEGWHIRTLGKEGMMQTKALQNGGIKYEECTMKGKNDAWGMMHEGDMNGTNDA